MSTNASGFVGDIPSHYDNGLGPNIFFDYADRIVDAAVSGQSKTVLELAAGTGIVSSRLRDKLPSDASLIITDLNAPMLDVARQKFSSKDKIDFQVANAMELPFGDSLFDLIVCQFGVMFFPDKVASYREAARVLKPGGRYVFNVWSAIELNPFSQIAQQVASEVFPDDPPGFYKVPFHYGDPQLVCSDLAEAGWEDVSFLTIELTKPISNPRAFAAALVFGNPFIDEIRERGGVDPEDVVARILARLTDAFGANGMNMPLSATIYECRKS
ncbi:class I SAM-dependent methyltransferase [Ruegeria lacuscaerulensis]|uniref:class I SAM-dependent methyltransferase n=1 Tax=Ruegeria lacuscaerulensis TaxID=55218 RepID=UPI00147BCCD6|nr:class I SAM-dependent methyltransferase [Ruegeria lacuscaerulensis]